MVDASIGGKTGCDFENYKNMIGSFFPAQQIHIYPEFVQSLSKEQYRSGLAEALKTALLYDSDLYQIIKTEKTKILNRDSKIIDTIIQKCAKAKANVVQEDFTEKNITKVSAKSVLQRKARGCGKDSTAIVRMERCKDNRSRSMSRPRAYAGRNSAKDRSIKLHGVSQGEKQHNAV